MQNPIAHDELVNWRREPAEKFIRSQAQMSAVGREARQRVAAAHVLSMTVAALFIISLLVG